VSIRPHAISLAPDESAARRFRELGWNVWPAAVTRVVYLGDALDVQAALQDGGAVLRLSARPDLRLTRGEAVTLAIPGDACIVVPASQVST
jgi:TOBE domain